MLDLRDVYKRGLVRLDVGAAALTILDRVVAGDDRGMNIEEAVRSDKFFTTQIITNAALALKKGDVKSLSHAAVLLGHEMVRDFILGHTVRRLADRAADTRFETFTKSRENLKRAYQASALASRAGDEHLGLAFAAGFIFDVFEGWINAEPVLKKHFEGYAQKLWTHSYRTASIARAICSHERLEVKYKRLALAAGIAHDVGKLFLACVYPEKYQPLLKKMDESSLSEIDELSHVRYESNEFDFSHCELGSLVFSKFSFLEEIETAVDFHHDFSVLKTRDPDMYVFCMILHLADRLALLSEAKSSIEIPEVKKILDPFRQAFPLYADEVSSMVFSLRSKGLFV